MFFFIDSNFIPPLYIKVPPQENEYPMYILKDLFSLVIYFQHREPQTLEKPWKRWDLHILKQYYSQTLYHSISKLYLVPRCDLVSFPPSQHGSERRQVSLRVSRQHMLPQAVRHLERDGCEHVLHVFLQRARTTRLLQRNMSQRRHTTIQTHLKPQINKCHVTAWVIMAI